MSKPVIYPVILSGGSGTRLWPLSRAMYPKQFIRFFQSQDTSFLGATLRRLTPAGGFEKPIIVCNNDHRFLVRDEIERIGIDAEAVILEPVARNTAAAVAVSAYYAVAKNPDSVIAVMPSDHVITDTDAFRLAVNAAGEVASTGKLVLFGIAPNEPNTGYGYIRRGAALGGSDGTYEVAAFVEKPDRATAERYLHDGGYYWNGGIFVLPARRFLDELIRLEPNIAAAARAALDRATHDLGFVRLDRDSFGKARSVSIDYAVMEKTSAAAMIPLDAGWNDVGSWPSLESLADRDAGGNTVEGEALLHDTRDTFVHSERGLVATLGVKDLIVVNTADATLVAAKDRAQDVATLVKRLKDSGRKEHEQNVRNYRPWGYFETLNIGPRFQVKLLHVKPGGKLSMQMHHHRSEHWIVVQGTAKVVIGETEQLVRENESVYIIATQWHRLENPGKVPVEIIEVQIGSYLGEDDIIRSDDVYQRAPDETK